MPLWIFGRVSHFAMTESLTAKVTAFPGSSTMQSRNPKGLPNALPGVLAELFATHSHVDCGLKSGVDIAYAIYVSLREMNSPSPQPGA